MVHRLLSLTVFFIVFTGATASTLQAEGSLAFLMPVEAGKSSFANPLRATEPLTLWCQVRDRRNGLVQKIDTAYFTWISGGKMHHEAEATLSDDEKNATLKLEDLEVTKAGRYTCHISAKGQNVSGNIEVFARPVLHTMGQGISYDAHEDDAYHFDASGHTVTDGTDDEVFTCPVFGHPPPNIVWTFNGNHPLPEGAKPSEDGAKLVIDKVDKSHEGTYRCNATSTFTVGSQKSTYSVLLDRPLRVKHWLSFLVPLVLIFIILVVLAIVISLCECRRKKNEQQLLEPVTEE
uniref:Ig-like domain-containing protein n=1 Tax=Steinernema glaseri TaxID=37863 RepID=A0A1I7Y6N1_9BILA